MTPSAAALAEIFRALQAGDAAGALAQARALIAAQPSNARAHMAAGLALRMLGQPAESLAALEEAARIDPADYGVAYEKGQALAAQGRHAEALECFARAAQLRPQFAPAHYAIGMTGFARRDWGLAIRGLERALAIDAGNPDVHVNLGLALAESGEDARAEATLRQALARFGELPAITHALGWSLHKARRTAEALAFLQAAARDEPDARRRLDLAKALTDLRRGEEAREQYRAALAAAPRERVILVTFGRFCVGQGDFEGAARLFGEAAAMAPDDIELAMYVAQVELARGRWREGWGAYARREPRVLFEAEALRRGTPYRVPAPGELRGRLVLLHAEQGLGDELFFLRFAPRLRELGARLAYQGDGRLAALLRRTRLFETVIALGEPPPPEAVTVLTADLPLMLEARDTPPTLAIAPLAERVEAMRRRLERAGPRPWIGVTWRAGTPRSVVSYALHKSAPIAALFSALPREGTVISLQREGHFEEMESASRACGRPIHDFGETNANLEEVLALVALLDCHVGVSSTNMHLAAAAGAVAHVLVPFPPEWRWGLAGESPWFPGFRVHRQLPDGDWSRAFAELANAPCGSTSRA